MYGDGIYKASEAIQWNKTTTTEIKMAKSKLKKKKKSVISSSVDENIQDETKVPIPNLPDKFLWMKVKSGTKIRNVLEYSLKEFSSHKCVVWSGAGQGVGKVISCAEIFKRKLSGLHQITKLRYVKSKTKDEEKKDENEGVDRKVPEIHILLSKDVLDTKEPGYQAPGVCSMFQDSEVASDKSKERQDVQGSKTRMSSTTAEEFAAMGLRTGQKRPRRDNQTDLPSKKNKKKENGGNK